MSVPDNPARGPGPDGLLVLVADRVVTPYRRLEPGFVALRGERIAAVAHGDPPTDALARAERVVELGDATVAPGFVDLHVHGGGGADVMDAGEASLATMARLHARGGTTSFLPTTTCAPLEALAAAAQAHGRFAGAPGDGARSLGLHLEGPYLAPDQAGALDPAAMRVPAEDDLEALLDAVPGVRRMTLAPELPGARRLTRLLRDRGVLVSLGHADPGPDELAAAVEDGAALVTHLWSGMRGVRRVQAYRRPGLVELSLMMDALSVELIADGAHLPPELLRLALRAKGPSRSVLVTDAMRAAGLGPGRYRLGGPDGDEVVVEDGVAKLPDRSAFAGSVATMDRAVRTLVEQAGAPLAEALEMASATPARLLGVYHHKGSLAPGKDADVTVLDADLHVRMTVVAGRIVYEAEAPAEPSLLEA